MYCEVFTNKQVYDGMTEINIACDKVFVTDGWICLYKDENFVASFDMMTINGWVLIDGFTRETPHKSRESHEKDCETCRDKDAYDEWQGNCDECENGSMYTPQTDCAWK